MCIFSIYKLIDFSRFSIFLIAPIMTSFYKLFLRTHI
uniref:Uncharacterized protein n=2 Tax=Anguilla anguilla TaxID=7936 RepID=A0A0E9P7W4_ANGAN